MNESFTNKTAVKDDYNPPWTGVDFKFILDDCVQLLSFTIESSTYILIMNSLIILEALFGGSMIVSPELAMLYFHRWLKLFQ